MDYPTDIPPNTQQHFAGVEVLFWNSSCPLFRYPLPFARNDMVEDPLFIPCHQSVQKWLTSVMVEQGTADVHSLLLLLRR